jgi:two-component system LytT family sensor kinase
MQQDDIDFLIYFLVGLIVLCVWLYTKLTSEKKQREILAMENHKLIAENALLEAEHLKFQLQPHTLRNMVATLHVAAKNLYKGSEALAETLDYILYQDNKHLVSIQDELSFLENYKSLQGNFVHQIDSIKIDKSQVNTHSQYFSSACVPHLITAYFVENAFKHGDVNHPEFLNIRVKLLEKTFEMVVTNRIKQKTSNGKGGLGLTNMKKRLDLLLSGKYEIIYNCNEQEYYSTLIINF